VSEHMHTIVYCRLPKHDRRMRVCVRGGEGKVGREADGGCGPGACVCGQSHGHDTLQVAGCRGRGNGVQGCIVQGPGHHATHPQLFRVPSADGGVLGTHTPDPIAAKHMHGHKVRKERSWARGAGQGWQ
jgi:hypothetical protein